MAYTNNSSIASGTVAQDILAAGHNFLAIRILNDSDTAMRVAVDAVCTSSTGENIAAGAAATFRNLCGRRVNTYGATTGKTFAWHEEI